jgi:hypothetical protein
MFADEQVGVERMEDMIRLLMFWEINCQIVLGKQLNANLAISQTTTSKCLFVDRGFHSESDCWDCPPSNVQNATVIIPVNVVINHFSRILLKLTIIPPPIDSSKPFQSFQVFPSSAAIPSNCG